MTCPGPDNAPEFRPVIIAPTFNNAGTLPSLLGDLGRLNIPMIVVNDGSTDRTAEILSHWSGGQVRTHPANQGKAAALLSGFAAARQQGFTHALTIDTDGQHDVALAPILLSAARQQPAAIILGTRDQQTAGYPARSRLGRNISNFFVFIESGLRVSDSQCGYRVYPLAPMTAIHCRAGYYGFETEILTRWAWAGNPVVEIPVPCVYLPLDQRVSHFRPVRDSLRAVAMHVWLVFAVFLTWFSVRRAWRELRAQGGGHAMAVGLACGAFIAFLPLFGAQSLLSLLVARHLKLNPLSVLAGSQLSFGPLAPVVLVVSAIFGHVILHGCLPPLAYSAVLRLAQTAQFWRQFIVEMCLGGVCLGTAAALLTYALARVTFRLIPRGPQVT